MTLPPYPLVAATLALTAAVSVPLVESSSPATVPAPAATAALVPTSPDALAPVAFGDRVVAVAAKFQGTPYRYGGTTPHGFDCSGFTRYVYAKFHKRLPRTAQQQFNRAQRVDQPRVGDLLFYHRGSKRGPVYHVVIYAGGGRVWHAPNPGTPVKKGKIYSSHWTAGRY
jgi:cell wall-associated NlpC family hydrolase